MPIPSSLFSRCGLPGAFSAPSKSTKRSQRAPRYAKMCPNAPPLKTIKTNPNFTQITHLPPSSHNPSHKVTLPRPVPSGLCASAFKSFKTNPNPANLSCPNMPKCAPVRHPPQSDQNEPKLPAFAPISFPHQHLFAPDLWLTPLSLLFFALFSASSRLRGLFRILDKTKPSLTQFTNPRFPKAQIRRNKATAHKPPKPSSILHLPLASWRLGVHPLFLAKPTASAVGNSNPKTNPTKPLSRLKNPFPLSKNRVPSQNQTHALSSCFMSSCFPTSLTSSPRHLVCFPHRCLMIQ